MITTNRSALVPKDLSSNAPASPINVSDMIDFSIRTFASSSSHCIKFCAIRAFSSSHSAVCSILITSARSWSLSASLSSGQEKWCFHVLNSKLQKEYIFLAIDTKRKTRWTYVISLKSSSVSLLIPAFRTSASVIRLHRLYDPEACCCASHQSRSAALSWTRSQSPCFCHSSTRSTCSVWLPYSWTSCLRLSSYSAFPLREHGARSAWFLSTLHFCFVESFTDTSISVRRILSFR